MANLDTKQFDELIKQLQKAPRKKISGFAKNLTYVIIILTFLIGIVGSFTAIPFDMHAFTSFIPMFASMFIPLILSIGVNSAFEKHEKAEIKKELIRQGKLDKDED